MSASSFARRLIADVHLNILSRSVIAAGPMLHRRLPTTVMRHITAAMISDDDLVFAIVMDRHAVLQHWADWHMGAIDSIKHSLCVTGTHPLPKPLLEHLIHVAIDSNAPWCLRILLRLAREHRPHTLSTIPVSMLAAVAEKKQGRLAAVLVDGLKGQAAWARMIAAGRALPELLTTAVKSNHPTMVDGIAHLCTAHIPRLIGVCAIAENRAHILVMLLEHINPRHHCQAVSCALWLAAVCTNTRAMSVLLSCAARHGMQLDYVPTVPTEGLNPLVCKMLVASRCASVSTTRRLRCTDEGGELLHLMRLWMVFSCTQDAGPAFELLRRWLAIADPGTPYLPPRFTEMMLVGAAKSNSATIVDAMLTVNYNTTETGPHMIRFSELTVIKLWLLALRRGHVRVLDVLLHRTPPDLVAKGLSPAIMIREATWRRAGRCMLARRTVEWVMDEFIGRTDQRYLSASAGACVY